MSPLQKSLTALAAATMLAGVGFATAQSTDTMPADNGMTPQTSPAPADNGLQPQAPPAADQSTTAPADQSLAPQTTTTTTTDTQTQIIPAPRGSAGSRGHRCSDG